MIYNMLRFSEFRKVAPVFQYADQLIWKGQFQSKFEDKATAIQMYEAHLEKVKATIPSDKLLLFDV